MSAAPVSSLGSSSSSLRSTARGAAPESGGDGFARLFAAAATSTPDSAAAVARPASQPALVDEEASATPDSPDQALLLALGLMPLTPAPTEAAGAESESLTLAADAGLAAEASTANRSDAAAAAQALASLGAQATGPAVPAAEAVVQALPVEGALAATALGADAGRAQTAAAALHVAALQAGATESARTVDGDAPVTLPAELLAGNEETVSLPRAPQSAAADFSQAQSSLAAATTAASKTDGRATPAPLLETLQLKPAPRLDSKPAPATATAQTAAPTGLEFHSLLRDSQSLLAPVTASPARLEPGSPQFTSALGQQIAWMADQKIGRAELRLDPEELGPLEVSLELDGDEIRAEFSSRSAEVRSLLDSQVPKLRELLAEQGFSLADAQIGQERAAYQDAPQQREGFARGDAASGTSEGSGEAEPAAVVVTRSHNGLIDDFA
jgi:flagellar hook-length control protein FliK